MFGCLLKREGFPGVHLAFHPMNMRMDVRNSLFLGILDSLAKFQLNIGILDEGEFRIPRTNQTDPQGYLE